MDSDSDSDASHISATPPRPAAPPRRPPLRSTPKPLLSNRKPQSKSKPHSTPKPSPPPPPLPPPPPPSDPPFPAADLSVLGLSVNLHGPSASYPTTPFSSLVRSRRPSFNPSDFNEIRSTPQIPDPATAPDVQLPPTKRLKCTPKNATPGPVKVHPNWIGPDVPPERQLNRPLKCSSEGNFVRLNINGHGRKYGYKFTKRGSATSFRGRRFRRRIVSERPQASGGGEMGAHVSDEEGVMDTSCEQRGKTKHGSEVIDEAVVAVREEASEENLVNLLKLAHGYDSFREGQLETIKRVLAGESMMLVLPTGAGKSLCYQLPALVLPGLTLVVSPLVALMVDQLRQLPLVIPGGLLSSSQTIEEASITLRRLREGSIKVLFVSPERFLNAEFVSIFGDNLSISLVVIDEAHCISEWSHNFRPSYLRLRASVLQSKLKVECFLAMTATATTQTLHDILNSLDIPPTNLIHTCQMRKNLQLSVTLSDNRLKDILSLMKSPPLAGKRSIIIYCKFQVETDIVSKYLKDNNIPAKAYHGGILAKNRSRIQELFCSNKIRVVVATVAFGMGLDKSDVEAVINYSLPESLEEYVQETGRAGRDGRLSFCHLFLDYTTYYRLRSLAYSDGVDEYTIGRFLSHIFPTDAGGIHSLVKESASRKFDMKEEVLLTILTQLEMGDVQYLCLLPQLHVTCTLYFHKTPPTILSNKDLLIAAIMKKSETKQQGHYVFDIPTVASHARITTTDLQNQLQKLKSLGEITYDLKDPAYCFEIMKKPDDFCSLTCSLTKWLSAVERCKVQKLDAMFHVANYAVKECRRVDGCTDSMHTPCIQRKISEYFCRDRNTPYDDCSINVMKSSPFLRADIKVFLQSNLNAKFTPRAVARIMHGIPSPAFPSSTWSKGYFWGRYVEVEFPTVLEAATLELMNFVGKGGV